MADLARYVRRFRNLRLLRASLALGAAFDAVFAVLMLAAPGWLAAGATVVVERGAGAERPETPSSWATTWERAYGDTLLSVATAVEPTA